VQLEGADKVGYAVVGHDRTVPRTGVESDALAPLCWGTGAISGSENRRSRPY
jgi:hypothetical protein